MEMKGIITKHIHYWRDSAVEDWEVGNSLIQGRKIRHGLFFLHLTLEKLLKAHVCKTTTDYAPRIHSLIRLADKTDLKLTEEQLNFLAEFDRFNIAGRYPDSLTPVPDQVEARKKLTKAGELYQWLRNQL